jgi:hypothetical protein
MKWFGADSLLKLIAKYRAIPEIHDVFGLVLYTEENPYVSKVLRKKDFWNALDSQSGKKWVIFAVRPEKGHATTRFPEAIPGAIQMLVPITEWHEPSENRKLLDVLDIPDTRKLPLLMVFTEVGGELLRCTFKISGNNKDETYASLSRAIVAAARAIENVDPSNIKNTFEIFNLIAAAADQEVTLQRIKSIASLIPYVEKIRGVLLSKQ